MTPRAALYASLRGDNVPPAVRVLAGDVPAAVARLGALAGQQGWTVAYWAAPGVPGEVASSVSLRLQLGARRGYGVWLTSEGTRWRGGASAGLQHFRTLAAFRAWIEAGDRDDAE